MSEIESIESAPEIITICQSSGFMTRGIEKIDWASQFQGVEMFLIDELEDHINDLDYDLVGPTGVTLGDTVPFPGYESLTYRQFLRSCFKRYRDTPTISVYDPLVEASLYCFEYLGLIAAGRKEIIILGIPL